MNKKNHLYLSAALLFGAVIFLFELRKLSFYEVKDELLGLHWGWFLLAIACMLVHWCIEAKIIQGLLHREQRMFSFKNAVRIPLIEHLFNAITPFSSGGQPAQLLALTKSGVDPGVGGSVCVMKFVVYQIMIVINFIACLLFGFQMLASELNYLSLFVLLGFLINIVVVTSLLMVMYCYPVTRLIVHSVLAVVKKFIKKEKGEQLEAIALEKMYNFHEESLYLRSQKRMMLRVFSLTFVQLLCYYIVPYFILLSLGINKTSIFQIIALHAFIILVVSLFPIPGGTGGAEYVFTVLFGSFIVVNSKLVIAILLWRIVTHYVGIFLGIIALNVRPDIPDKVIAENIASSSSKSLVDM